MDDSGTARRGADGGSPRPAPGLLWLLYPLLGSAARAAAAVAPSGRGKLSRSLAARRGIRERYRQWGQTQRDRSRPLLWVHAPSVGEGLQARPVIEQVRSLHPEVQLAYTHFSPSASSFAASLPVDVREYLPFDTPGEAKAALDAWQPTALVFSKLDVWPALAREAERRGVRLGLISATLAEASGRRSGLAAALLGEAYGRLDAVGAIDAADAERLVALGVRPDAIEVTGDTRYDQVWARARATGADHPLLVSLRSARPTLIAGSTWPADERVLLPAWERIRVRVRDARFIIVPHEPTPAHLTPIQRWAAGAGLRLTRLSSAPDNEEWDVLLVDRTGVLGELYALGDVAYVGGGFHAAGLHSVLEPAAFGAPVVFGPRHLGSRDAGLLLDAGGARAISSVEQLTRTVTGWFEDDRTRKRAGAAARAVVERGLGAAARSTALVERLLGFR